MVSNKKIAEYRRKSIEQQSKLPPDIPKPESNSAFGKPVPAGMYYDQVNDDFRKLPSQTKCQNCGSTTSCWC